MEITKSREFRHGNPRFCQGESSCHCRRRRILSEARRCHNFSFGFAPVPRAWETDPLLFSQARRSTNSMDQKHKFRVVAWWSSGQNGIAKSDSAPNAIHFTAPVAIGGSEGRWTPEDLLLCAIASCFTTTCRDLAEHSKLEYSDLQVKAEGVVSSSNSGYRLRGSDYSCGVNGTTRRGPSSGAQAIAKGEGGMSDFSRSGNPTDASARGNGQCAGVLGLTCQTIRGTC